MKTKQCQSFPFWFLYATLSAICASVSILRQRKRCVTSRSFASMMGRLIARSISLTSTLRVIVVSRY